MAAQVVFYLSISLVEYSRAQDTTSEYNRDAYRARREMQWMQMDEMTHQSNPDMMEHMKYQMSVNLYQILAVSKRTLEDYRDYDPTQVPQNPEAMEAWVLVLECTVLLSELVMRFPNVANIITNQNEYEDVMNWALDFAVKTTFPDDDEVELMDLAKIELDLASRPPGYLSSLSVESQESAEEHERGDKKEKEKDERGEEPRNAFRDEM